MLHRGYNIALAANPVATERQKSISFMRLHNARIVQYAGFASRQILSATSGCSSGLPACRQPKADGTRMGPTPYQLGALSPGDAPADFLLKLDWQSELPFQEDRMTLGVS